MEKRALLLSMLVVSIYLMLFCWMWFSWKGKLSLRDDYYIHLVYARNIVWCHTLGFNCGEYSAGWSSPLYLLLLLPLPLVYGPIPPHTATVFYGWALNILVLFVFTYTLYSHLREKYNALVATSFTLFTVLQPGYLFAASEGMETLLITLFTLLFGIAYLKGDRKKVLLFALLGSLTRYEFAIFCITLGAFLLLRKHQKDGIYIIIPPAAVLATVGILNTVMTGIPVPTSGAVKQYIPYHYPKLTPIRWLGVILVVTAIFLWTKHKRLRTLSLAALSIYLVTLIRLHYLGPPLPMPLSSRYHAAADTILVGLTLPEIAMNSALSRSLKKITLYLVLAILIAEYAFFWARSACNIPPLWLHTTYNRHVLAAAFVRSFVENYNVSKIGVSDVGYIKLLLPDTYVEDIHGLNTTWVATEKINAIKQRGCSCGDSLEGCIPSNILQKSLEGGIRYWALFWCINCKSSGYFNERCERYDIANAAIARLSVPYDCSKNEYSWQIVDVQALQKITPKDNTKTQNEAVSARR